jgi:exosortase C (VPDSG-CTERM-specific)
MSEPEAVLTAQPAVKAGVKPPFFRALPKAGIAALLLLVLAFGSSLYNLAHFASSSTLYSHILLIPFISLYFVWSGRSDLPYPAAPAWRMATVLSLAGLIVIAGYWVAISTGLELAREDSLTFTTLSFVLLLGGVCSLMGQNLLRAVAFPLGFLVFMAPVPTSVLTAIETGLQYGSGATAHAFFRLAGTPVFYQDLYFQLPAINLHVAPECSGIRSTLVLFIVSVITGYFFLRSPLNRTVLTLAVVPLALLRNGFRIFTIGELCVRIGPEMADSFIHRRGGPIFFALSLVPFFLLLLLLMRSERRAGKTKLQSTAP